MQIKVEEKGLVRSRWYERYQNSYLGVYTAIQGYTQLCTAKRSYTGLYTAI